MISLHVAEGASRFTWWKSLSWVRLFGTPWTVVDGILQARILEWVPYPFSSGSSQRINWTRVSCIAGRFFTSWATREAQEFWNGYPIPFPTMFLTQESNWGLLHCRQIFFTNWATTEVYLPGKSICITLPQTMLIYSAPGQTLLAPFFRFPKAPSWYWVRVWLGVACRLRSAPTCSTALSSLNFHLRWVG